METVVHSCEEQDLPTRSTIMGPGHRKFEKWVEDKTGLDFVSVYLGILFSVVGILLSLEFLLS